MKRDPKRLSEADAGPLGDMLRAARGDELDAERVARIQAGVAAALAVGGVGAGAAAGGGASAGAAAAGTGGVKWGGAVLAKLLAASVAIKVGAVGAVLCAVGTGIAIADHYAPPEAPPSLQAVSVVASNPHSAPPVKVTPPAPLASGPAPVTPAIEPALLDAKRAQDPAPARAVASASSAEGALLLRARAALETDPARALDLVHQHEAQFPTSQLVPERERIAAEASARLGH